MESETEIYWLSRVTKEELLALGVKHDSIFMHISPDGHLHQCALTKEQVEALIPKDTLYCYTRQNGVFKLCPFWDMIDVFPKQSNGHCHYLKTGDYNGSSFGLLWDQCKECGISDDIPENEIDFGDLYGYNPPCPEL